jgi:prophage regulatory protein
MVSAPTPSIPSEGFIDLQQVLTVIPVSRSTWYAMVSGGLAPKPIRLAPRRVGYAVEDIRAFIEGLKAASLPPEVPRKDAGIIRLTLSFPGAKFPFPELRFSPEVSNRIVALLAEGEGEDRELNQLCDTLRGSSSPDHG